MHQSPDIVTDRFGKQQTSSYPVPRPDGTPETRVTRSNTIHTISLNVSNVSQLWREVIHHEARGLNNHSDRVSGFNLERSVSYDQHQLQLPGSWPPPVLNAKDQWLGPVDAAWLSSSPESVTSSKTNFDLGATQLDHKAWPFCLNWSLDATMKDPYATNYATKDASIQTSGSYGSDTDTTVWSGYHRHNSVSPIVNIPGQFCTSPQTMNLFQPNPLSDAIESSLARLAISPTPIGSEIAFKKNNIDNSTNLLAKSSFTSRLTKQLEKHQAREDRLAASRIQSQPVFDKSRIYVPSFSRPSFFPVQTDSVYAQDLDTVDKVNKASTGRIKTELYKTEMCRNWEEKGFCDYNDFRHDQGGRQASASTYSTSKGRGSLLQRVGFIPREEPARREHRRRY
ncbi:hypothetical protein NDA16_001828 [Ustilago loliicola]|nr:hypothetical protein NDA16_001828 [Ustilago loliicola]